MKRNELTSILHLLEKGASPRHNSKELLPALRAVAKVTPEVPPLAATFMSTGSLLARRAATTEFYMLLLGINQNKDRSTKSWQSHEDIYREQAEYYTEILMTTQMTLGWHFNNVASELGMDIYDVDRTIHYAVQNCPKENPDEDHAEVYWRGFSALHLASTHLVHLEPAEHNEFIEWAGSSDNISRIVTVAQERGILVPNDLRAIMAEQDSIASSLGSGTL